MHGTYQLRGIADGYALSDPIEIVSTEISEEKSFEIKLDPCTPDTCGVLTIILKDEDDLPVANARIALMNAETDFYAEEYGLEYTDFEGKAVFENVASGNYYAVAQKFPSEGTSQEFEVIEGSDNEVEMGFIVGNGIITVEVIDADDKAIPFAIADFRTQSGEPLGKVPLDSQGKGELTVKADKKVFVVIEAEGYANYTSHAFQIMPGETTAVKAILRKAVLGDTPIIEFDGVFTENGKETKSLSAGKMYTAKFTVIVPIEAELEQFGAFFTVGDEKKTEKDSIYINKINAPKASVLKGATYNPTRGTDEDEANVTNGEAKWANAVWESEEIRHGIYEIEIEIAVKETTTPGKVLPLYYRTYGITPDSDYLRDPFDEELQYAARTSSKHELYANSHEKLFYEGATEKCDEMFCYSERVLDKKEDIYLAEPYDIRIFGNYGIDFTITNNSEVVHDNAEIRIKNSSIGAFAEEKLKIQDYEILNADAQEFSSSENTFEIEPILLGDFTQNKTITGILELRPEVLGETALHMQIVSDRQIVFEKFVKFNSVNKEDMNVTVLPKTLPAFTEFDLNVEVRYFKTDEDFEEIKDAFVRVTRTTPDRQKSEFTTVTDGKGQALLVIPASDPDTRIKIRVEKEGYAAKTINLKVSDKILEFDPESLKTELDLTDITEEQMNLKATSFVPVGLHLTKMRFNGNFLGLLDEGRMNNYIEQYIGRTNFSYGFPVSFTMISAISDDARLMTEPRETSGDIYFEVANNDESIKWPQSIPFSAEINLAQPPKEKGCIEISLKEWRDVTLGGRAEVEFTIRNNCLSKRNQPLDLSNLQAKIDWKSNKYGNVELHILDPETNQEAKEALNEALYSTFFDYVPAEKEFLGLLVFTPKGGTIGEKAEFNITIDAGQATNSGEQLVGSSNDIEAEIDIIDLTQCIKYEPDAEAGLILQESEEEGTITIDTTECGSVEIDFWMCKDDQDCAGGAEGGIQVKPNKFTMNPNTNSKTILVSREEIPGMYGIKVFVRTPGSNYRQVGLIDVLVKPEPIDAFTLSKYEFALKGMGTQDSAQLTNRYLVEEVMVDASICDWADSWDENEKKWDWAQAGVGALAGAVTGLTGAATLMASKAKDTADQAQKALDGVKKAQKAAETTNEKSETTLQEVCDSIETTVAAGETAAGSCADCAAQVAVQSGVTTLQTAHTKCKALIAESSPTRTEELGNVGTAANAGCASGAALGDGGTCTATTDGSTAQGLSQAEVTKMQAGIQAIVAQLETAAGQWSAAATTAGTQCAATVGSTCCGCAPGIATAIGELEATVGEVEAFAEENLAEDMVKEGAIKTALEGAKKSIDTGSKAMTKSLSASAGSGSFWGMPAAIFAANTIAGFLIGGMQGLFGDSPCDQRHSSALPDYVINLLEDFQEIESSLDGLSAELDIESAQVIGPWEEQRVGVMFTNDSVSEPEPVYSTFSFNTTQHLHANPTEIDKGCTDFGPFNIPDHQTLNLEAKIHLKFKTQETIEEIPDLTFDTLSCTSGNKIGRTGVGALPKVKLAWDFQNISVDECNETNENGIYCDATQFSIMLSHRLENLRKFFEANPQFDCPENPFESELLDMGSEFEIDWDSLETDGCYITDWSGYLEGKPAMLYLIEGNADSVRWTSEIPDKETFMDTVYFTATLMQDGYSKDFREDFAQHYSEERFFDTPDWFHSIGLDSGGDAFGVGALFANDNINFRNKFFDSDKLSSAGVYEILLSVSEGDDGTFRLFDDKGEPNAAIEVQFYLLEEPNPNSAFYSMPLDGLVGLEGDSGFNRQGYGVSFDNKNAREFVTINNDSQAMKTYTDAGSNPMNFVDSDVRNQFFELNTSPSGRGNLFILEKTGQNSGEMLFQPSKATPVMMKVNAPNIDEDDLSAFYTITNSDVPVEVGSILTYWSGAGACLDFSGVLVTDSFDERPDRAAIASDPVLNWQRTYGVDFGRGYYAGDTYLRTIFYSEPTEDMAISVEQPKGQVTFITPDQSGGKVQLTGVSGTPYNNPAGGSSGSIGTVEDVFELVKDERVCVIDSGRKAEFFWNPKAVYELEGKERNLSTIANELQAGVSCIGYG